MIDPKAAAKEAAEKAALNALTSALANNLHLEGKCSTKDLQDAVDEYKDDFPLLSVDILKDELRKEIARKRGAIGSGDRRSTDQNEEDDNKKLSPQQVDNKKKKKSKSELQSRITTPDVIEHCKNKAIKLFTKGAKTINEKRKKEGSGKPPMKPADVVQQSFYGAGEVVGDVVVSKSKKVNLVGCSVLVISGKHSGVQGVVTAVHGKGNMTIEEGTTSLIPREIQNVRYAHVAVLRDEKGSEQEQKVKQFRKESGGTRITFVDDLSTVEYVEYKAPQTVTVNCGVMLSSKSIGRIHLCTTNDEEDAAIAELRFNQWVSGSGLREWFSNFIGTPTNKDLLAELERLGVSTYYVIYVYLREKLKMSSHTYLTIKLPSLRFVY